MWPKTKAIHATSDRRTCPIEPPRHRAGRDLGRAWARLLVSLGFLFRTLFLPAAYGEKAAPAPLLPGETQLLAELATQGTNATRLFRLADLCHDAGAEGDKAAVVRAEAYLRETLRLEPGYAAAKALLGSVYTMKGRDAFWPVQQLRWVRDGNELMDQAVQAAPDDLQTRLIRVFNNAHMPDWLGRTEIVRADLAWLWEKAEKEPERFTAGQRQKLALHWGRQLKRQHRAAEARRVWESGHTLATNSPVGLELATELSKLR